MANHYHQLSLKDTFSGCKDMFMDDVPSFFQLLEQHFDISFFIPQTFYNAFYQRLGRKRDYPLTGFLSALILQKSCSTAVKGRTSYTYENLDFRMFPGIQRDSGEWDSLYKIRTTVERAIDHLKINMCVAGRKSRNHTTTKADVFLAGIASQLTVIVAHGMNCPQYIRSLKLFIA